MTNSIRNYDDPFYGIKNENKPRIKELFANGDLLTYSLSGNYYANKRSLTLTYENKVVKLPLAKYSLLDDYEAALFSDGTLVLWGDKQSQMQTKFVEMVQQDGFAIKKIEFADSGFLFDIRRYAEKIYKDKFIEVELPDEQSFIDELYKNNNVCISAESDIIPFEARKFLALFSNGRFIVSNRYIRNRYNPDLESRVQKAIKKATHEMVVLDPEYVPDSYIKAIYQRAEKSENFLPQVNKPKPDNPELMNAFLDRLFANNNQCLTIVNLDDIIAVERDVYALFEDDRLIINEDKKYSAAAMEFTSVVLKNLGKVLTPEYVPAYYLPAIYERALQNQKSAKDILIETLKKKAQKMVEVDEIELEEALEIIAIQRGFKSWHQICEMDEDTARIQLGVENRREFYLKTFGELPENPF